MCKAAGNAIGQKREFISICQQEGIASELKL
jgi:hypothetical protein